MSRPERRKSSLAGTSPLTPPPAPVATSPVPAPAAEPTAAVQNTPVESSTKPKRPKMSYYVDSDQDGRIRAAFYAGRDKYRWRNMTDMQIQGVMGLVEALEREMNGGQHFEPMPPGTGPLGRPVE